MSDLFIPAWAYLLVKRDEVSEVISPTGIIGSKQTLERHKPRSGKIIAAGPDCPKEYAPGVRVAFNLHSGFQWTVNGDPNYVLLPSSEVMAYAVDWEGSMEDGDALAHLEPPPGCMLVERLPLDDSGAILRTGNHAASTQSPFAEVHKVAPNAPGPFKKGETVFLSQGVSRGIGLGFVGERPILTVHPTQVLGWVKEAASSVQVIPDDVDASQALRAEHAIDDRFDQGDPRAPR